MNYDCSVQIFQTSDGVQFGVYSKAYPGCAGQGDTVLDAVHEMRRNIFEYKNWVEDNP